MAASSTGTPGPPRPPSRLGGIGYLASLARDVLGTLERWAEEAGDVYRVDIPGRPTWVVNRPEEIERVLVHNQHFVKNTELRNSTALFGNGLITSDGEFWKRQRRMMQPAFHKNRMEPYAQRMVDLAERAVATWTPGEVRDVHKDAMALSLSIAMDTLFGDDEVPPENVGEPLDMVLGRFEGVLSLLPTWLPLPAYFRYRRGIEGLNNVVYGMIARGRQQSSGRPDLLSILLEARDEDGSMMSDRQLRDEILALLLAGHETGANALTWTWHLLADHPEAERKLLDEADALNGPPTMQDLPRLPYTSAVVNESLRLFPPIWIFGREVIDSWEVAGFPAERGMQISLMPWIVHRDRRFYPEPLRFRPERWLDGSTDQNPDYSYFPFGGGQRMCIGRPFATIEAPLVLATVARRYRIRGLPGRHVEPVPSITLRPRGGLPMRIEARQRAVAATA